MAAMGAERGSCRIGVGGVQVRGCVAGKLGLTYIGIDLSHAQACQSAIVGPPRTHGLPRPSPRLEALSTIQSALP